MKIEQKIHGTNLFKIICSHIFLRGLKCVVLYRTVYCLDNYIYGNSFQADFNVCRPFDSMIILLREMYSANCSII